MIASRFLAAVALAALGHAAAAAPAYEEPGRVASADVLPRALLRSASYDLADDARVVGNFYRFEVSSDFGEYSVTSRAMLRVRLRELATLAEVTPSLDAPEEGFDRSPGGRRGVASERVVDLLGDPVGTASQLLGNLQHNLEATFVEGAGESSPGGTARGAQDLDPGPHKRSAAAQLGVDVYSSNPALQALLDRLARARSSGDTASLSSPLMSAVHRPPRFGSGVFDLELESLLKNQAASAIALTVEGELAALGVARRERVAFLTHPAYTPRTRLYFVRFLGLLGPLDGLPRLVAAATGARTEVDALAYVDYARMLAHYQVLNRDLARVVGDGGFPALASVNGRGVLALPVDQLSWTAGLDEASAGLAALAARESVRSWTLLLAGEASPRAAVELAARSIELRPAYSF